MKWADYGISAVRYSARRTYIESVRAHPDKGAALGPPSEYDRETIVEALRSGLSFVTVISDDKRWILGRSVRICRLGTGEYLRTDEVAQAVDDLETLPEF